MPNRKPYPSDVSDEEWAFAVPYLALVREDSPQRNHELRDVLNGLRWVVRTGSPWRYMPHDLPPWEAVYQQTRRWLSGRRLRGDGPRFARTFAPFGGQSAKADGGDSRQPHPAFHSGERLSGRLRRSEAQEGLEGSRGGGHFRTSARLVRRSGLRTGAGLGGRAGRGRARCDRRIGGARVRG